MGEGGEADLTYYKPSTIMRRIRRRMQLHHLESLARYVDVLGKDPCETEVLANEFLINVTEYFRDGDTFALLEREIIPKLFPGQESWREPSRLTTGWRR